MITCNWNNSDSEQRLAYYIYYILYLKYKFIKNMKKNIRAYVYCIVQEKKKKQEQVHNYN